MERCQIGMVSLAEHRKTIRELKEKWAEELMIQKLRGEELQKELKELKKVVYSFLGIVGYQSTIFLLPCIFI